MTPDDHLPRTRRRATPEDHARLLAHDYRVERSHGGWVLVDQQPDSVGLLQIGSHGQVAPTEWEAVAEGLRRIREDEHFRRRR